jgi:hypothetical protein
MFGRLRLSGANWLLRAGYLCVLLEGCRMFHEPRIDFGNPGVAATILLVTFMAGVALGVVAYLASCCP